MSKRRPKSVIKILFLTFLFRTRNLAGIKISWARDEDDNKRDWRLRLFETKFFFLIIPDKRADSPDGK